jgi:hypothetical protein
MALPSPNFTAHLSSELQAVNTHFSHTNYFIRSSQRTHVVVSLLLTQLPLSLLYTCITSMRKWTHVVLWYSLGWCLSQSFGGHLSSLTHLEVCYFYAWSSTRSSDALKTELRHYARELLRKHCDLASYHTDPVDPEMHWATTWKTLAA